MRNWPKTTPSLWDDLLQRLYRSAGYLMCKSRRLRRHPLAYFYKHRLIEERREERSAPFNRGLEVPPGLSLEPELLSFIDVYFPEDVASLKTGIHALRAKYGGGFGMQDQIEDFFRQRSGMRWSNLATLFPAAKGSTSFIDSIHLGGHGLSPSVRTIAYHVIPSKHFLERFRLVLQRTYPRQSRLQRLRGKRTSWVNHLNNAPQERAMDLESLFLEINRQVVQLLRTYLGVGLAMHGPLPTVEVFVQSTSPTYVDDKSHAPFWDSLEIPHGDHYGYRTDGVAVHTREFPFHKRYYERNRIIINEAVFVPAPERDSYLKDEGVRTKLALTDWHRQLTTMTGLKHYVDLHRNAIEHLSLRTSPRLRNRGLPGAHLFERSFRVAEEINVLTFEQDRFDAEMMDEPLIRIAQYGLDELTLQDNLRKKKYDLGQVLRNSLTRQWKACKHQLQFVRNAYRERLNTTLQWASAWISGITVLLAILGVLSLLTEAARLRLWEWVCSLVKGA